MGLGWFTINPRIHEVDYTINPAWDGLRTTASQPLHFHGLLYEKQPYPWQMRVLVGSCHQCTTARAAVLIGTSLLKPHSGAGCGASRPWPAFVEAMAVFLTDQSISKGIVYYKGHLTWPLQHFVSSSSLSLLSSLPLSLSIAPSLPSLSHTVSLSLPLPLSNPLCLFLFFSSSLHRATLTSTVRHCPELPLTKLAFEVSVHFSAWELLFSTTKRKGMLSFRI